MAMPRSIDRRPMQLSAVTTALIGAEQEDDVAPSEPSPTSKPRPKADDH
jgi:hypothetical protein